MLSLDFGGPPHKGINPLRKWIARGKSEINPGEREGGWGREVIPEDKTAAPLFLPA